MPKRKNKSKNKRRQNDSGSSAPSTPSVDDDTQQLLPSGACGFSESQPRKSSEGEKPRSDSENRSPCRRLVASSSKNQSDSTCKELLAIPGQGSDAAGPSKPSQSTYAKMKEMLKKSPNRPIDPECSCEDKNIHEPECPELKRIQAKDKSPKDKSSKRPNDPKTASSNASALSKEGLQSSSSSDPSVKESYRNTQSDSSSGKHNLTVPNQCEVSPSSPPRKGLLDVFKFRSPKKTSSTRSLFDSECGCADKNNHELKCAERRYCGKKDKSPKRSPNKSDMPSSSSSSSKDKEHSDASNTASGNSRKSKSPSASDRSPKDYLHPDGSNRTLECSSETESPNKSKSNSPSRSSTDYDPGEGTSRGPAKDEHGGRWRKHIAKFHKLIGFSAEERSEDKVPLIEITDIHDSEEKEAMISHRPFRRRRPKSFGSRLYFRIRTTSVQKDRSQQTQELRSWTAAKNQRSPKAARPDPDQDRKSVRRLERSGPVPAARRHQSESPRPIWICDCPNRYRHEVVCSREIEARRRRNMRKCRQDVSPRRRPNLPEDVSPRRRPNLPEDD